VIAMALSQFIALPLQTAVAFAFVHRHVPFSARALLAALAPSAVVTLFALAGPALLLALNEKPQSTLLSFALLSLLSATGWLVGLHVAHHPFLAETQIILRLGRSRIDRLKRYLAAGA
jgi:lipopolysaccharide exporter